jgi:hypothetical protein
MKNNPASISLHWPNLVIMVGGLLMVVLWPVYINLHGPTSYNLDGHWLGQGPEFWGSMMEGPAYLLIALGLFGHYSLLAGRAGRKARVGFVLIMIGLIVTALVELAILAIAPPLLSPLVAIGLILVALSNRENPSFPKPGQYAFWGMSVLLLFSFFWTLLLPMDVFDRINGYIVFGITANLLFGVGWIVFGTSLLSREQAG